MKTLSKIIEAVKWTLLPITLTLIVVFLCLGILMVVLGGIALEVFASLYDRRFVPSAFIDFLKECWHG